ncbi:ubiE/COQ5 methyltransferase family protein, partial [Chlamydia psittaci 84-8471/1]
LWGGKKHIVCTPLFHQKAETAFSRLTLFVSAAKFLYRVACLSLIPCSW